MRFLARAPDLALAMWAVFPMPRGDSGQSQSRVIAGELPHGPLCRLRALHVELTTGSGGAGRVLHFFMPCTHRHARFFVTPIDFFWDLTEKSRKTSRIRTADLRKKTSLSYRDGCFSAASFSSGGALGTKALVHRPSSGVDASADHSLEVHPPSPGGAT